MESYETKQSLKSGLFTHGTNPDKIVFTYTNNYSVKTYCLLTAIYNHERLNQ